MLLFIEFFLSKIFISSYISSCFSFTKIVNKGMTKAEMILKVSFFILFYFFLDKKISF